MGPCLCLMLREKMSIALLLADKLTIGELLWMSQAQLDQVPTQVIFIKREQCAEFLQLAVVLELDEEALSFLCAVALFFQSQWDRREEVWYPDDHMPDNPNAGPWEEDESIGDNGT